MYGYSKTPILWVPIINFYHETIWHAFHFTHKSTTLDTKCLAHFDFISQHINAQMMIIKTLRKNTLIHKRAPLKKMVEVYDVYPLSRYLHPSPGLDCHPHIKAYTFYYLHTSTRNICTQWLYHNSEVFHIIHQRLYHKSDVFHIIH